MSQIENISSLVKHHLQKIPENDTTKAWIVSESALEGRGLFADCDMFPGDLIFVDHALIRGSRASARVSEGCVSCHSVRKALLPCSAGCGLLVCSSQCQSSPEHIYECQLIMSWKVTIDRPDLDSKSFVKNTVPLKALLLEEFEKRFLLNLAVHDSPRHGGEVRFIKKYFCISAEEEALMMQACRALDANAYEMMIETDEKERINLRGLFPVAALMNHCCVPNTRSSFDEDGRMYVHASAFIPKGSEVLTSYTGLLWGTPARRHHLMKTKHFSCECARCRDRTECGTRLCALRCIDRSCSGVLLPVEPLDFSSFWRCELCCAEVSPKQIGALQSALGGLLGSARLETPDAIYDFIEKNLLKFMPESNHIVLELKCKIVWSIGDMEGYRWSGNLPNINIICIFILIVIFVTPMM